MCGEALFRSTTPKIRKTGPRKVNHALLKTIVLENPSMTQLKMAKTMCMSQAGIAGAFKKSRYCVKKRYHIKRQIR